jgi:hypothetical protein
MQKIKPRDKVDTSGRNMLRNEKRERVLGLAIAAGRLSKTSDGKSAIMEICANRGHDVLDWEMKLIEETGWIKPGEVESFGSNRRVHYRDSNKLRIYHKWLYCGKPDKTLKNVLKYMYSPLFASLMLIHRGVLDEGSISMFLDFDKMSVLALRDWFKDLHGVESKIAYDWDNKEILVFTDEGAAKLLELCRPIISQIPGMYQRYYENFGR